MKKSENCCLFCVSVLLVMAVLIFLEEVVSAAELKAGFVACDFTPPKPVALDGQMGTRISRKVTTPLKAGIAAFEGTDRQGNKSQCILASFDMVGIRPEFENAIQKEFKKIVPDFDLSNLILSATHTHTAPVADKNKYYIDPKIDCMRPEEFNEFAGKKIACALADAWKKKEKVSYNFGMSGAVIAYNRRSVYADGHAQMYGNTNRTDFRAIEGQEDHDVNSMFFWNEKKQLAGMIVNVTCPAQEVEGGSDLNADYWHPTREALNRKFGQETVIITLCGAAGDMSPHTQYRKNAENRMSGLRNLSRVEEIGRRVFTAVDDTWQAVEKVKITDIPFAHLYSVIKLPQYRITQSEYESSKKEAKLMREAIKKDPNKRRLFSWANTIVERYEAQQKDPMASFDIPIHVFRIGDVAFCTNPFELFTAYGTQIKARSSAVQTFVVQLTDACAICGTASSAGYLPTQFAYNGGGYSAIVKSITVGPDGGQILVEETLKRINELFKK